MLCFSFLECSSLYSLKHELAITPFSGPNQTVNSVHNESVKFEIAD
ncbi:unnamed protein product [Arabidopsis halleri]